MPLYTWECPACGYSQEGFRPSETRDEPMHCAECGELSERIIKGASVPTPSSDQYIPGAMMRDGSFVPGRFGTSDYNKGAMVERRITTEQKGIPYAAPEDYKP